MGGKTMNSGYQCIVKGGIEVLSICKERQINSPQIYIIPLTSGHLMSSSRDFSLLSKPTVSI